MRAKNDTISDAEFCYDKFRILTYKIQLHMNFSMITLILKQTKIIQNLNFKLFFHINSYPIDYHKKNLLDLHHPHIHASSE